MTANRMPKFGEPLDIREMQVLQRMAVCMSNPEIGHQLYLSEDTIKTYARRLFRKLGATNRMEAVLMGIQMGIIPCPCGKAVAA